MASAAPVQAQDEPETTATPVASPTAQGESIWNVGECSSILAEVRDAVTGAPMAGARVLIEPRAEAQTSAGMPAPRKTLLSGFPAAEGSLRSNRTLRVAGRTSPEGTIILPAPGAMRVHIAVAGYVKADLETPCSKAITVLEVEMARLPPEQSDEAAAGGDAHRVLSGDTMEDTAGTERNMFGAVESLPGIALPTLENALLASVLGEGDLSVRGARPGESLTYLDGIEIPYFYHYLGLSSVIPAEMVEFADFIPGGEGPQFGHLTGGVVDIHSHVLRGEDLDQWHGRGTLNLWESNAIARGPVGDGMLSVSGRGSFINYFERDNRALGSGIPIWDYGDYQAVYKLPTGSRSEFTALAVGSLDDVAFDGSSTHLHTQFDRVGLSWRTETDLAKWQLAANYGDQSFLMNIFQAGQGLYINSVNGQQEIRLAANAEFHPREDIPLRTGAEMHFIRPEAGLVLQWEQQNFVALDRTYTGEGAWAGAWVESEFRPIKQIVLIPGIRYDYDTLAAAGWIDPRMTVRAFVLPDTVLSASGGLYHQPYPFAVAFDAQSNLGLTQSTQLSGGALHTFGPGLSVDARVFWNTFQNQVQGVEWIPDFNQSVVGRAHAVGIETYGKFATASGRDSGSLGVTLQQSQWNNTATNYAWTATDLDSTWAVTALLNHHMHHDWLFALRARYYTGLPYTTYAANVFVPDQGAAVGVGASPFGGRSPYFFQLDVRFTKHWDMGSQMGMEAFLDVENLTNRSNDDTAYSINTGAGVITTPSAPTSIPIFFPNLGLSLTF